MTRPANILIVEDERIDLELILAAFRRARLGNTIRITTSGDETLDYIFGMGTYADRKEFPLHDLILLDLNLPGTSGFEVLRQVRNTPKVNHIPVIVLTSSKAEGDRTMAYDLGANDFLIKPVTFEALTRAIEAIGHFWIVFNVNE